MSAEYDEATLNEDWIRTRTWDLPTNPESLVRQLGLERAQRLARNELPAGLAMPEELRQAVLAMSAPGPELP